MVISNRLYKIKHDVDGNIERFKSRFVARGFSQVDGVEYEETSKPVGRYNSIKDIMSMATYTGWILHQMDVKSAFQKWNHKRGSVY